MATQPIWILKDDEPVGGYYAAQEWKPDLRMERKTVSEVRVVEMDSDLWNFILHEGGAPLDADESNDSTWIKWWAEGDTVWTRD